VWLGWILASSSDILSRIPSRWRIKRNLGLSDVGLLCCIPYAQALLMCNQSPFCPSHSMCGVNPKAALAFHSFLTSSCDGVVCERRLKFSNSIDALGMGPSPNPIYPKQMLLANDCRTRFGNDRARTGAPGSCGACGH